MPSEISEHEILFAGFPTTGKTSFLVALWHVVNTKDVPGALRLGQFYEGDREYINTRYQEWLNYKDVKRTWDDQTDPVVLSLGREPGQDEIRLSIPDLSGETFKRHFTDRTWSLKFAQRANQTTMLVLFINPDKIKDANEIGAAERAILEWEQLDAAAAKIEDSQTETDSEKEHTDGAPDHTDPSVGESAVAITHARPEPPEFTFDLCCTQVKHVDLLQFISNEASGPLRVAVVVSALDVLDNTPLEDKPEEYVTEKLALLDQLLKSQPEKFEFRVYGVSAQGAKYDADGKQTLQDKESASERIRVVSNGVRDHDITRPLRWLAFGAE